MCKLSRSLEACSMHRSMLAVPGQRHSFFTRLTHAVLSEPHNELLTTADQETGSHQGEVPVDDLAHNADWLMQGVHHVTAVGGDGLAVDLRCRKQGGRVCQQGGGRPVEG